MAEASGSSPKSPDPPAKGGRGQFPGGPAEVKPCRTDRTSPLDPGRFRIDNDFYGDLGDLWWDREGRMSALHEMTPVRLEYFDGAFTRALGAEVRSSGLFVDVGCGGGILTEAMAGRGYRMLGLDVSEGALSAARRHAAAAGARVEYRRGSVYDLGMETGTVDGVIAADLFEHLHDFPRAVSECGRVLKPGGVLAFETVNRTWLSRVGAVWLVQDWLRLMPPHTHHWRMFISPAELKTVFQGYGLEVGEIRGISPAAGALTLAWRLWKKRTFGRYKISSDLRISYLGYAVKKGGEGDAGGG